MVSVVIPAYNEEKLLPACLKSLVNQVTDKQFEVIVVDNNSTDKTRLVVEQFATQLHLRVVLEERKGRGSARQKGFEEASGEIVLSTDADTVVPDNWIDVFSSRLENSSAIAVTGSCQINDCGFVSNYIFNFMQPLFMRLYRLLYGQYWLSGFSFGIYRDAYLKSGGFDRDLNAAEDIDLSFKVAGIGNIQFISDCPVIFSGRRFKYGLMSGLTSYIKLFLAYTRHKVEATVLSDLR